MLDRERYESLKDKGLGFSELCSDYITPEEYKELKFEPTIINSVEEGGSFANYASFYYYKPESEGLSPQELALENCNYLRDWDSMQRDGVHLCKHGVVMMGSNAGSKAKNETYDHFEMFQSRSTASQVRMYKCKLEEMNKGYVYHNMLEGAYLTDFFKGLPSSTAKDLKEMIHNADIRANGEVTDLFERLLALFEEILLNELEIIGNVEHIIVMGKTFFHEFVKKTNLDKKFGLHVINHYSSRQLEQAALELEEIYKKIVSE